MGRRALSLGLAALLWIPGACARDREEGSSRPEHERAPENSADFSGRVPKLSSRDTPRDTLRLRRRFGDSLSFARVTNLRAVGDYLLVSDALMSVHLSLLDARSGEVLHQFGRHGRGPGEFRDPTASAVPGSRDRVWIYDFKNRRATLLRLSRRAGAVLEKEIRMDHGVSLETPIWKPDGIIANGIFQDYTLLEMDANGRRTKTLAADPPFGTRRIAHPTGRRLLNRSFLAADPARRRLALAYQFEGRVDFFTADGRRYGSVAAPRPTRARWRVAKDRFFWEDANEMAYWQIEATERYVYTLFCGCRGEKPVFPSRLHIFRWNGDFVREIELDRQVTSFTVTADDRVLYGSFQDPHEAVGEWRLPEWLQRSSGG